MINTQLITKKKFDRIIIQIKKSIDHKDDYLPKSVTKQIRQLNLWTDWSEIVISNESISRNLRYLRKLAIPVFIKKFRKNFL